MSPFLTPRRNFFICICPYMGIWVFPTVLSHKGYWVDNEQEDLCADEGRCSKTTHARKADTHGKQAKYGASHVDIFSQGLGKRVSD